MYFQCIFSTQEMLVVNGCIKRMKPLLLADGNLRCGMYPAGKVAISRHLAIPGFPQVDHTVGKLSADAGLLCSEA